MWHHVDRYKSTLIHSRDMLPTHFSALFLFLFLFLACDFNKIWQIQCCRTWLIGSSTLFEVSVKTLPDSYHFMFRMHG